MTKDKAEMVYCALGKFVAAVSRLDLVMGHLLEAITHLNPGIARSIYLSQDSVSARRAIVDQAAANALHDPTQLENYREISSTVADLMARRNRFLHDIWLSDEQTGDPTLFSMKVLKPSVQPGLLPVEPPTPVDPAAIEKETDRAEKLLARMQAFHAALIQSRT